MAQSIEHLRYYAGWADKIYGQTIPCTGDMIAYTLKEPLGEPLASSMHHCPSFMALIIWISNPNEILVNSPDHEVPVIPCTDGMLHKTVKETLDITQPADWLSNTPYPCMLSAALPCVEHCRQLPCGVQAWWARSSPGERVS